MFRQLDAVGKDFHAPYLILLEYLILKQCCNVVKTSVTAAEE